MKNILFPTDFSKVSFNAYAYALDLAVRMKAKITTLHAYIPSVVQPEIQLPFSGEAVELLELDHYKEAAELMHRTAAKEHHEGVEVDHILQEAFPVESILNTAQKINADVIVMGSKGASGIAGMLLGSTASSIVEQSPVPVYVIPDEYTGHSIDKIGFAIDLLSVKQTDIDKAIDMAAIYGASLTCFHIDDGYRPYLEGTADTWREKYTEKVHFEIFLNNFILDGISEYVTEKGIDLLVMKTERRSFLGNLFRVSFTRRMTMHSTIPICVFK